MQTMKPRDRVFAALEHGNPDRVPGFEIWIDPVFGRPGEKEPDNIIHPIFLYAQTLFLNIEIVNIFFVEPFLTGNTILLQSAWAAIKSSLPLCLRCLFVQEVFLPQYAPDLQTAWLS